MPPPIRCAPRPEAQTKSRKVLQNWQPGPGQYDLKSTLEGVDVRGRGWIKPEKKEDKNEKGKKDRVDDVDVNGKFRLLNNPTATMAISLHKPTLVFRWLFLCQEKEPLGPGHFEPRYSFSSKSAPSIGFGSGSRWNEPKVKKKGEGKERPASPSSPGPGAYNISSSTGNKMIPGYIRTKAGVNAIAVVTSTTTRLLLRPFLTIFRHQNFKRPSVF